jgi:hypothetical protein
MKSLPELLFSDARLPSIGVKAHAIKFFLACQSTHKPTGKSPRIDFRQRNMEGRIIMENRITNLEELAESRKPRKSEALPMREILAELFDWCQARFPEFCVTAEMQGNS